MGLFTKTRVGNIVKIVGGILKDKYGMIAKEHKECKEHKAGYSIVVEPADWPAEVPNTFNAIFVPEVNIVDCSEEEETLLRVKFPKPDQFE